jgi:hypothetical protein
MIRPEKQPREGWDEAFARMHAAGDDLLLDRAAEMEHLWDAVEWEW